jgi:ABC-type Fe3+-hydroxamate transport system substrate-binding protein
MNGPSRLTLTFGLFVTLIVMAFVVLPASGAGKAGTGGTPPPPITPVGNWTIGTLPANPTRLASSNSILIDGLLAMGYNVPCWAFVNPLIPQDQDLLKTFGAQQLSFSSSEGFDIEQLAACKPDEIVQSNGSCKSYTQEWPIAPLDCIYEPQFQFNVSQWKAILFNIAATLPHGAQQRAATVVSNTDRQAAALHGFTVGKKVAFVEMATASSFYVLGNYQNVTQALEADLGMINLHLDPNYYTNSSTGANCDPSQPQPGVSVCDTQTAVSDEVLPELDSADVVFLVGDGSSSDGTAFTSNPLYQGLTAVKAGRDGEIPNNDLTSGPDGVSIYYTTVAHALGITQYYTTVSGGIGAKADFALDPASGKACWAIQPTPGKANPTGPITLRLTSKPVTTVTLSSKPRYFDPEAKSDPQGGNSWETYPSTYESDGCLTLTPAETKAWTTSGGHDVHLAFGGGSGLLKHGTQSVAYPAAS